MKFSIIIPSFNHAHFIQATLDSVIDQNYHDIEIIVNDGGSTDDTVKILDSYGTKIHWSSGKDRGQTDAINKGLSVSTGDIVAYLNSDDIYFPKTLETVAEYFRENPACDLLYGEASHLNEDGTFMETYPTSKWDHARLYETCFICQPATFWRRSMTNRIGVFDERLNYAMDYEYWLRAALSSQIVHLPGNPLAGSRLHAETKTLSSRLPVHREILAVVRRYAQRPQDTYSWMKHLAGLESIGLGFPPSAIAEKQYQHQLYSAKFRLSLAEAYFIELDDEQLSEIHSLINDRP